MAKETVVIELKPKDRELVKILVTELTGIHEELKKIRTLHEIMTAVSLSSERDEEKDDDYECKTTLS